MPSELESIIYHQQQKNKALKALKEIDKENKRKAEAQKKEEEKQRTIEEDKQRTLNETIINNYTHALTNLRAKLVEEASKHQLKPTQIKSIEELITQADRIKAHASFERLTELTNIIIWANDLLHNKESSPQTLDLLNEELSRSSITDKKVNRILFNIFGVILFILSLGLIALGILAMAGALTHGGGDDGLAMIIATPILLGTGGVLGAVSMINTEPQSVAREIYQISSFFSSPKTRKEEAIEPDWMLNDLSLRA